MDYSISEAAQRFSLKPHTLRYYESEGLLHPQKGISGVRRYSEQDMERLSLLCCLKETGMALKDIKQYFDLCDAGDGTAVLRLEMLKKHRACILAEIDELKKHLVRIERKISIYEEISVTCGQEQENTTRNI